MKNNNKITEKIKYKLNINIKLKKYNKPEIVHFGAMKKYTLGGSIGVGDSGMPMGPEQP